MLKELVVATSLLIGDSAHSEGANPRILSLGDMISNKCSMVTKSGRSNGLDIGVIGNLPNENPKIYESIVNKLQKRKKKEVTSACFFWKGNMQENGEKDYFSARITYKGENGEKWVNISSTGKILDTYQSAEGLLGEKR